MWPNLFLRLGGPKNLYLQNGKELQEDGFGGVAFAMYDATIGRFVGIDPLADGDPSYSPYAFCGNNPANFFDPDGLKKKKWNWKKILKIAAIVIVAVAVMAIIAAVPVIVCPGTALAGFVGGGTGATTLGSLAAGMISSAAGAIVAAGGAILGALPAIATALTGAFITYKTVELIKESNVKSTPVNDGTRPTSNDCGCGNEDNPSDDSQKDASNTIESLIRYVNSKPTGFKMSGGEVGSYNSNLGLASTIVKSLEKVDGGIKLELTLGGRIALKATQHTVPNGTIFHVQDVLLGDGKRALRITGPGALLFGDPLNVYIRGNNYSIKGIQFFPIFK